VDVSLVCEQDWQSPDEQDLRIGSICGCPWADKTGKSLSGAEFKFFKRSGSYLGHGTRRGRPSMLRCMVAFTFLRSVSLQTESITKDTSMVPMIKHAAVLIVILSFW
jgi:hypothetical protein